MQAEKPCIQTTGTYIATYTTHDYNTLSYINWIELELTQMKYKKYFNYIYTSIIAQIKMVV